MHDSSRFDEQQFAIKPLKRDDSVAEGAVRRGGWPRMMHVVKAQESERFSNAVRPSTEWDDLQLDISSLFGEVGQVGDLISKGVGVSDLTHEGALIDYRTELERVRLLQENGLSPPTELDGSGYVNCRECHTRLKQRLRV
jgi:hypothetical protein